MLHLLQPAWLFAASGIIIPVAIHLWNVKQGKTLKVGSIQLLAPTEQSRARSLRLTELFLLLLRCLLILLLALLLAKPYWQDPSKKGWVLMERKDAQQAYTHFKPMVDSLLQAGYTFHLFEKGFEEKDLQTVLKKTNDTTAASSVSYWSLVKQLDKQLLPGIPVYLFTGNRLSRFTGKKPEIGIALTWKTFTHADSVHEFVANAYMGNNDSIMVTIGKTNPSGTTYRQLAIAADKPRQKDLMLDVMNGNLSVSYQNGVPVPVDTTTLHVTVFADQYFDDSRYLKAAIQSIQQVKKSRIAITVANTIAKVPVKQDWLFWLSTQTVPTQVTAANQFIYQTGNTEAVHSSILVDASQIHSGAGLYKRIAYQGRNAAVLWRDGFGMPLLTQEIDNTKQVYRFYSRLDPSWNDLPWSETFPELVYGLINNDANKISIDSNDRRVIDETELQLPVTTRKIHDAEIKNIYTTNAKHVVWVIIFIVFVIERFFSFEIKKEKIYA